jgi:hypothetical protein
MFRTAANIQWTHGKLKATRDSQWICFWMWENESALGIQTHSIDQFGQTI